MQEKRTLSIRRAKEYIGCQTAYEMTRLGLNYKTKSVGTAVLNPIMKEFYRIKEMSREEFNTFVIEKVNELYTQDLLTLKIGLAEERTLFAKKIIRLADYLRDKLNGEMSSLTFMGDISAELKGNVAFEELAVKDTYHFSFTLGGQNTYVTVHNGKNPYSQRARKPENHPMNQLEHILMYLGTEEVADTPVKVETWYLTNKEDGEEQLSVFEGKAGGNIASAVYSERAEAMTCLETAIAAISKNDCKNCQHKDACATCSGTMNVETKVAKEVVATQPKEPMFSDAQKIVVNHKEGPMAIVAVPGAGKTTSLVHRLKQMLTEGIKAEEILFITFTKKAAGEIRERVEALLPEGSEIPDIFTFNAFGYKVLKDYENILGRRFCLASPVDRKKLVKECLESVPRIQNISYRGANGEFGIINQAATWVDTIMQYGKEAFAKREAEKKDVEGIFRLYDEYEKRFKEGNFISFEEQISLTAKLFKEHPEVPKELGERYRYIMVDEYQDTDDKQAEMIYAIAKQHNNIVVVGDDDQNIYEWRGGSAKFMLQFEEDFPNAKMVFMSDNWRSNDKIINAANALIGANANRYDKELIAHKSALCKPVYYPAGNADTLKVIVKTLLKQYRPGEIAVLARKNKPLEELEPVLSTICKVTKPKDYLIDDYVFRLFYDVFTCYRDMNEDVSFYRLLRHFGVRVPAKEDRSKSLYENLVTEHKVLTPMDITEPDDFYAYQEDENRTPIKEAAYNVFKALKACQYYSSANELFDRVCDSFLVPRNQIVVEQLREIADLHAFENINQMQEYMDTMITYKDTQRVNYTPDIDTLVLMTCHDSKGKEFPCVIIYGTEDYTDNEDDNRLLYVAMTRAKNNLFMLRRDTSKACENIQRISGHLTQK